MAKKDSARAEKLAAAAAKLGYLQAHLLLGTMYFEETPLQDDELCPRKSRSHYIFAARNGHSKAMTLMRILRLSLIHI